MIKSNISMSTLTSIMEYYLSKTRAGVEQKDAKEKLLYYIRCMEIITKQISFKNNLLDIDVMNKKKRSINIKNIKEDILNVLTLSIKQEFLLDKSHFHFEIEMEKEKFDIEYSMHLWDVVIFEIFFLIRIRVLPNIIHRVKQNGFVINFKIKDNVLIITLPYYELKNLQTENKKFELELENFKQVVEIKKGNYFLISSIPLK